MEDNFDDIKSKLYIKYINEEVEFGLFSHDFIPP
jgi:hypothetical protein